MSASWTFILADASGNGLAELSTASGRSIAYKRNSYAEATLTLSHEDDAASLLFSALANSGVPKLKAYRRGPNDSAGILRFRGYLSGLSEQSEESSLLTATFRSPFGVLMGDGDKSGRFLTSQFPRAYASTDAGLIAKDLIDKANLDSPTGLATDPSLIAATTVRNATYSPGLSIGQAIMNLSALLDGFDFYETFVDSGTTTTSPPAAPVLNAVVSGSATGLPLGTYYYVITALYDSGVESPPSNEVSVTITSAGQEAFLTWGSVPGVTNFNIYRSTVSGGEMTSPALIYSGSGGTLADDGSSVTLHAGASPPRVSAVTWNPDAFFNVVASLGSVNPNARFEYGPRTLANVMHMDRTTSPPLNTLFVTGGNGLTSTYSDVTSVGKYGKYWGHYDFPDIIDQTQLDSKARALCRPNPIKTVTIVPEIGLDNCPKPFDDWNLGDTGTFYASRGALTENTQLRINGFTVPINENGYEATTVDDPTSPEEDAVTVAQLEAEVDVTS